MSSVSSAGKVLPAQLAFLTIYNPAFGDSDETEYEQIFFHYSNDQHVRKHQTLFKDRPDTHNKAATEVIEAVKNEQLRQVGLARGMVDFANNFSNGTSVSAIETEKSRIVLHELEPGWWILVSIDLTRLPAAAKQQSPPDSNVEFSSREVAPGQLLIAQLQRAHDIFLLHQAANLNDLHTRLGRPRFSAVLEKYWTRFSSRWDVLLHGNPIVDVYNGTKLAGGGELGIGVGEEEWGSGEREVLEDFVHRTEGLKDLIVGRYGDAAPAVDLPEKTAQDPTPWLGTGNEPLAADGLVFSGIGALSRRSLATVSQWMEAISTDGDNAYGVGDNPSSRPRARRKKQRTDARLHGRQPLHEGVLSPKYRHSRDKSPDSGKATRNGSSAPPRIPPPVTGIVERALADATRSAEESDKSPRAAEHSGSYFDSDKMVSYLKLGYGSSWTLNPKGFSAGQNEESNAKQPDTCEVSVKDTVPETPQEELNQIDPVPEMSDNDEHAAAPFVQRVEHSIGRFLIGLPGDLENAEFEAEATDEPGHETAIDAARDSSRIFMRTVTVQLDHRHRSQRRNSTSPIRSSESHDKLRVIVYVHRPFIFVFLFDLQTASLTMPSSYRSIHHQLGPLQKPLLRSTDPARIPERLMDVLGDKVNQLGSAGIYDWIYDPAKLTVRTSIPNIPLPGSLAAEGMLGVTSGAKSAQSRSASGAWYTLGIPIGAPSPPLVEASSAASRQNTTLVRSDYTRLDALNIHSQLLHTYIATRPGQGGEDEIERTVKTARGWWIVWMRSSLSPSTTLPVTPNDSAAPSPGPAVPNQLSRQQREGSRPDFDGRGVEIEAFLVRRAIDPGNAKVEQKRNGSSGRWLGLGGSDAGRSVSGASAASSSVATPTSARGVVEGMGIDARKWVEALAKLSC
ncbi:uncharacterized protein AB675_5893 [Cyphellophora attinorum]|uniref:CCZ1/INTU/HSP4 first Longin domain-containing protein n=1 Tax=Cyphellophora attinorum TaxID=1664694 RepID=A0A0N1H7M8_9EURO|nr:uncharacterized protein AB675_5893 [Phialophora attinorum]KPI38747.1 hypothetical protein AB675_5893 [Phialophora attinorum]